MDKNLIPKLRFHRALEGLSESELEHIASRASTSQLDAGEVLLEPNQAVDALYLVMQGRLRIVGDFKNAENQTLRLIGPGEHFGALGIVLNQPLPCTVFADQPTIMLRIPREELAELLDHYPRIRQNLSHSIGTALKSSLLDKTASSLPRFVAGIQFSPAGRGVVGRIAQRLSSLEERIALLTDADETYAGSAVPIKSLKRDGKYLTVEQRAELLREVSDMERVFIDVDGPAAAGDLEFLVDSCDVVFWIATNTLVPRAVSMLEAVIANSPSRKDKMRFVCLPSEQEMVATSIELYANLVDREFKIPIQTDGSYDRLQQQGVERIVHHLRDVCLGIALGGGAARGMAHLGVLKVLESAGIYFDMMSGTSAGALTGVQVAAGYEPDFCVDSFETDLKPNWFFRMMPKGDAWYLVSKYRGRSWDRMLRSYLFDWRLEQLAIPFKGVSVDLIGGRQVIYEDDDAVRAIVESINLPGISAPICRDGMALVDGSTLNTLPADVLVNRGCNYVVAVNVSSKIKHEFGGNRPDTPTAKMKVPGIRQTLARERIVQDRSMNAIGARPSDFVIEPDISGYAVTDFPKTREIAAMGQVAAEQAIEALRESLMRVDAKLFGDRR